MSGIIYKISSTKGEKVYYGSTIQPLSHRFNRHRSDYKASRGCTCSILFKEYGIDNCIVEMVEQVAIDLLRERECHWIDVDENCVNKYRPYRSEEEKKKHDKECTREWRKRNKEKTKEYNRLYRLKKKELSAGTLSL